MNRHTVDALYVGSAYVTCVWISEQAANDLASLSKSPDVAKLIDKIEYWAKSGFWKWEGSAGSGRPIIYEGDGVFRLGYRSVHRVLGFYENDNKGVFIAIDAFLKKGQKLSSTERGYIAEVARVKRENRWAKRL